MLIVKDKITISVDGRVLRLADSIVDRLYIRNRSQAIEYLVERSLDREKTAVIMATGPSKQLRINGNEFRSTAKVGMSSVVELALLKLREAGFKKLFIIGEMKVLTAIFEIVGNGRKYGMAVEYIEDKNPPGTAASLRQLKGRVKNTFLVAYGDIIFGKINIEKLWRQHFKHKGIATILVTNLLSKGGKSIRIRYLGVEVDGEKIIKTYPRAEYKQCRKIEKALSFSSLMIAEPEIFDFTGDWLEEDVLPALAEKGLLYSYLGNEGEIHIHSRSDISIAREG